MTRPVTYQWTRWWVPAGAAVPESGGFPEDPESPMAMYMELPATRLANLDHISCLLLFGDSGLGKTDEINVDIARLAQQSVPTLRVDLGEYESWAEVESTISADAALGQWNEDPTGLFFVYVDGVDEVAASMSVLADRLPKLLGNYPHPGLRVRVAGRAYAFPTRLRDNLAAHFDALDQWDAEQPIFGEYDLLPLTRSNVGKAAAASGHDPERFLDEVDALEVGVLASRPITLNLYLGRDPDSPLPPTRVALYEEGTQRLVRESNGRILDATLTPSALDDLIRAAQKLAAVSLLAAQPAVAITNRPGVATRVSIDELADDADEVRTLRAATASSLFGVETVGTVRFTHRDFAEFLTAQRLASMSTPDAVVLLADPNDLTKAVPQLAGTAAWTAQLHEGVFEWLLGTQPELLATPGTLRGMPVDRRRHVVRGLLTRMEAAARIDRVRLSETIDYPELADDLAPYLDPSKPYWVRREVALLMHDAGRQDLDTALVTIVEGAASGGADSYTNEVRLSVSIVASFRREIGPDIAERLLTIVGNADAPFELRRAIVDVLADREPIPDLLTELSRAGFADAPATFLDDVGRTLATAIQAGRIRSEDAATWLLAHGIPLPAEHAATNSIDQIVGDDLLPDGWFALLVACTAAAATDTATVPDDDFKALAALLATVLDHTLHDHEHRLRELPQAARRRISQAVLEAAPRARTVGRVWHAGLLTTDDFEWALTQYDAAHGEMSELWEILARILGPARTATNRDTYAAEGSSPKVRAFLDRYFSDELLQDVAREAAESEERSRQQEQQRHAQDFNLERLTAAVEAGRWGDVANELVRPIGNTQWVHGASLTETPGWKTLTSGVRNDVIGVAAWFLDSLTNTPQPPNIAAVGAAYTLLDDTGHSQQAPLNALSTLFPLLLDELGQHRAIESLARRLQPTHAEALTMAYVNALNDDLHRGLAHTSRLLGGFTSAAVEDALNNTAVSPSANSRLTADALIALAERHPARAAATALEVMRRRPATKPERLLRGSPTAPEHTAWDKAVGAAAALATTAAITCHFDDLLTALGSSPDYARAVIEAIDTLDRHTAWPHLTTQQLGQLYEWAGANLPQPPVYRPGVVYDVVAVHDFRMHVLNALRGRRDDQVIGELRRLAQVLGDDLLNQVADEVTDAIREATWTPLTPRDVRALLDRPDRRVIRTEAELAHALLTALDAVARDIATNINQRALYWDKQRATANPTYYAPPDEPEFMIRLAFHMRQHLQGVSLWHEVELNHGLSTIRGSEADILATVETRPDHTVAVVIEGKGNWHREVETAIETQLHDRYLTGNPTSTGIYVVGAFHSPYWLPSDGRRDDAKPAEELRPFLMEEATRLSTGARKITVRVIDIPLETPVE